MPLLVGTSGWQYRDWRDRFYPRGLAQRDWLGFYARHFATVEVNNAFYRLPERSVFERWRERTPAGFVVAVKASRFLTHIRRLREPVEPVARLVGRAGGLGDRLGPVLLQLPPGMPADAGLLDACLDCFPAGLRVAVEPRTQSWWSPRVRSVLESRRAALCWADRRGRPRTPLWRTADWGYLRMHEGRTARWPHYGRRALAGWLDRIEARWPPGDDVHVYVNNDQNGAAVVDAAAFAARARRRGHRLAAAVRPAP